MVTKTSLIGGSLSDYGLYNSYLLLTSFFCVCVCEHVCRKALFDSTSFSMNRPKEKCKIRTILFHRVIYMHCICIYIKLM